MAAKPGKKPQPPAKPFDEFEDEAEGFEEEVPNIDGKPAPAPAVRSRDWRDVEKYREMRELRKLVGDDLEDLLDVPSARENGRAVTRRHRDSRAKRR